MFLDLFVKECKLVGRSILFYAFIVILLLFYSTQYEGGKSEFKEASSGERVIEKQYGKIINNLIEPKETDGYYGSQQAEVPDQVIPNVANYLYMECWKNEFTAYPYGFIKHVKLEDNKLERANDIFEEITGYTIEEVSKKFQKGEETIPVSASLSYEGFKELMLELEGMIGKGSRYSDLERYGSVEKTYEEARVEYEDLVQKDKVSGAYARLFSDYMGIVLAFFPIFVVVAFILRDKRANMQELIYSREASAVHIVGARYLALVVMMFLPVLLLGIYSTVTLYYNIKPLGLTIDYFAFFRYSVVWLLPTLFVTTAIGYILTEVTQSAIAIVVQGMIWFVSLSTTQLSGDYAHSLMVRHNMTGGYDLYITMFNTIIKNRIYYTLFAFVLIVLTIILFNIKRSGKWNVKRKTYKISRYHKK